MLVRAFQLSSGDLFSNYNDGYSLLLHSPSYQTMTLFCPDGSTVRQM